MIGKVATGLGIAAVGNERYILDLLLRVIEVSFGTVELVGGDYLEIGK